MGIGGGREGVEWGYRATILEAGTHTEYHMVTRINSLCTDL